MATMIPTIPNDFGSYGDDGEEGIFKLFKTLPKEYTIFYSLEWIEGEWVNGKRKPQGEADFVIFHKEKGILVLEVKSGIISFSNLIWTQKNRKTGETKEIDPLSQASRSKFKLMEIIDSILKYKSGEKYLICHAVFFPSITFNPPAFPLNASREICWDERALVNLESTIDKTFEYWKKEFKIKTELLDSTAKQIVERIAPEYHAVASIRSSVEYLDNQFARMTKEQSSLVNFLDEQKIASIQGIAGTGKTFIAIEKAKRLAEQGRSVLFLCYNNKLKEFLSKYHQINKVYFHNVHSLAYSLLDNNDIKIEEVLSCLKDELINGTIDLPYQDIIIDEGQDIDLFLLEILFYKVKANKGYFYIFFDRNQSINNVQQDTIKWIWDLDCRLTLYKNCRNTKEIAIASYKPLNFKNDIVGLPSSGNLPVLYLNKNEKDVPEIISNILNKYISTSVTINDIAILTIKDEKNTVFKKDFQYKSFKITEDYLSNNLLFTTVRKFKGLESKVIILIDVSKSTFMNNEELLRYYVGVSRARHFVFIISSLKNEEIPEIMNRISHNDRIPKNINGFKRLTGLKIEGDKL
ncbi:MAG: NERD domain-containing protein [Saprospiraceae bacterium]|nr:NERD domain-containing protein [Saprospiraceae bacterium]MBP6739706.1 NERD domain-containing protein [Leptospiraceae bacterium]